MTPEDRRTQTAQSIAQADAAVARAYTAAHATQAHADAAGQEDKTLNKHAADAYDAADLAKDYRYLVRSCAHYATRHDADPKKADQDVSSAAHHAGQVIAYAAQAEKAQAAAAKRAARAARQAEMLVSLTA